MLRQGAICVGAGGAVSFLGQARAGAQPSLIRYCGPQLPLHPDFPTSPRGALPEPVRENLDAAMRRIRWISRSATAPSWLNVANGKIVAEAAEPCPMCATCAVFARVAGVAYGTSLEFLMAQPNNRVPRISMPQVVATGPLTLPAGNPKSRMPVVGGVLHKLTDQLFEK